MVFMRGMVTLSSFKLFSKIVSNFSKKEAFLPRVYSLSWFKFIADKYSNKELELALSVLSVRPPELVMRPFRMEKE